MSKIPSQVQLYNLSRDTQLLLRLAILITAISTILAFFLIGSQLGNHANNALLVDELEQNASVTDFLRELREERQIVTSKEALQTHVDTERVAEPFNSVIKDFIQLLFEPTDQAASQRLLGAATSTPPIQHANALLGDLAIASGDDEMAHRYFTQETIAYPDQSYPKIRVLEHGLAPDDRETMKSEFASDRFYFTETQYWLRLGTLTKNPRHLATGVLHHDYSNQSALIWALTLLVLGLWFTILFKITYANGKRYQALGFGIFALVLGFISASATLVAVIWQEEIIGLKQTGSPMEDLLFYVLGVGVREETIKLLFFLPLTPFLYHSRNPKLILLAAAGVGLGFAAQENIGYLASHGTLARYVTANFFHIALTGSLGFAFCRFLYTPKSEWERFLATFIAVIVIHGIYDFLLTHQEGSFFAIIVFGYSCHYFFDLIEKHCPASRQNISPLSVFVLGCAAIFGCSLIVTATMSPDFHTTIESAAPQLFSSIPLMFLYINRFRHA